MRADRDPAWVQELAARRGLALADASTSQHLQYRLEGTLGPAGGYRPWTCTANRYFLDDGGTEDWVDWACPSLLAASPRRELILLFGSGASSGDGAGGDLEGAAVLLGVAAAVRALRRPAPEPVTDVLAVTRVADPDGVLTGRARELFCHWPVVDGPLPPWRRRVGRFLGKAELPPDAPPDPLHLTMTVHTPLSSSTRDWWQLAPRLEHQIELGIALGEAVVTAGSHA